ncbi:MAG: polyprenyl synthetase family protein [Gammaproteobacteria bacterium]|nr:polyprenyl synthetase family protein [Gammaproteobacteria bacterium]
MSLDALRALVRPELAAVDDLILGKPLSSDVPLINQIGHYIIESGGKRLRPLLLLLAARCFGPVTEMHVTLAAVIEFIHTATLLHDDVVDHSELRRGHQTTNALWGNEASVLVGDFLYSRAFQLMVQVGSMPVMAILSDTTNAISEGEVLQLTTCHSLNITEEQYLNIIQRKTAKLFEASAELGALNAQSSHQSTLAQFGLNVGMTFQIIDDLLDFTGSIEYIGKNIGDDLAGGKLTLPLIYLLQRSQASQKKWVQTFFQSKRTPEQLGELKNILETNGIIKDIRQLAKDKMEEAIKSLESLPPTLYREALATLAHFAAEREY